MGVFDDGYEQRIIDAGRNPITSPPSGFLESFKATYQQTRQEDLSISERQNFLDKVKLRNEKILELTGKPLEADPWGIEVPAGKLSTTVERARLSAESQVRELSRRYPEIKNDDELLREIVEDSKRIRQHTAKVLENTTFSGKIGSFTGAMAASMTDPLVFGSIPFGASTSAGILKTFLTEAGINMASEALIQPFVYRYKQKLGSPYDLGEAAIRIAAAGVGGGTLAAGIKGIGRGISRLRGGKVEGIDDLLDTFHRNAANAGPVERDAAHVLGEYADTLRESPFEPHPDLDDLHLKATAKAIADVEAGRPVDVASTLGIDVNKLPRTIGGAAKETPATTNQSLAQFIKNSGGVNIEEAGALKGEYNALYESGGRTSGAVKRATGKSPDELAQKAYESGFIEEPDPALLKDALEADLSTGKIYSVQGDRFEHRMDLQLDREYARYIELEEAAYMKELETQARAIVDTEDFQMPTGRLIEGEHGELKPITRSAKETLDEADDELKIGEMLKKCMTGGE
jgi:hypothetical protein